MKNKGQTGDATLIDRIRINRNVIFLVLCIFVHTGFFVVFFLLNAIPFCVINAFSVIFYALLLMFVGDREKSERATVYSYFEILVFSIVSEIFTRNTFGFIFFPVGLVPVIFFLCPSYGNKRFIFQIFGFAAALLIQFNSMWIPSDFYRELYEELFAYSKVFSLFNLLVTLFTIMYASIFYKLDLDEVRKELDYASKHDPLTGLFNRRFLYDAVKNHGNSRISLVLMDIDNFKKINDIFGHDEGDAVLIALSSCLKEEKGEKCYPVRWGGEEFILYYKDMDDAPVFERASALCRNISEKVALPDGSALTVTVGLASGICPDFDKVVKKADEYLYLGKKRGKNCIVWKNN